jgi:hypothetical protein
MRRIVLAISFALSLIAAPMSGQAAPSSHEQAALDFLKAVGIEKILQEISAALANNLIRSNPPLATHRDVIVAWTSKYVTWEAAAPELVKSYTKAFSEPELREITAFYDTPTGRKMAAELPRLMENAAAEGGRLAGSHIADLEKMLQERAKLPQPATPTTPSPPAQNP